MNVPLFLRKIKICFVNKKIKICNEKSDLFLCRLKKKNKDFIKKKHIYFE